MTTQRATTFLTAALLAAGLAAPLGPARSVPAAQPSFDFQNLAPFIAALDRSTDPQAKALRQQIADSPAALARERSAAQREGLLGGATAKPVPSDQNGAALFEQWHDLMTRQKAYLPNFAETLSGRFAYTPEQLARVQKVFDDNPAVFSLLHEAADRPYRVYADEPWKHGAHIREAARELKSEDFLLAHAGRYADAVAAGARGLNMAKQDAPQANMVGFLVDEALETIALDGLRDTLAMAGPDADVDVRVAQAVRSAQPVLSLRPALLNDVTQSLAEIETFRRLPPAELASLTQGDTHAPAIREKEFTPTERRFVDRLLDAVEAQYLSEMRVMVAAADLPPDARRAAFGRVQAAATKTDTGLVCELDPLGRLLNILLPTFGSIDRVADLSHAHETLTLAAAAVLGERSRTGVFPAALPGDFPDPFSAKPLVYRREGDGGFVVYSVGPDGKFDGGRPGVAAEYSQVVFRHPAPPPQPVPSDLLK